MKNGVTRISTSRFGWVRGVMLFSASLFFLAPAQANPSASEYQVKAAFLLNFLQFIDWPSSSFADDHSPMIVGVLGDDPFGDTLDQTLADESIRGRKVVVKRSHQVEDLRNCHLLFISRSEKDRIGEIIASLGNASIVTVSEQDGFCARGGIIDFYLEGNKVRFEINARAAEQRGLRISAQLLRRARIFGAETARGR